MIHERRLSSLPLMLVGLLLAGCSARHPTLLAEAELAGARADSLGLDGFLALSPGEQAARAERADKALRPLTVTEVAQQNVDGWLASPGSWTPYATYSRMPVLGDVIQHLDGALGLDPARADLWYARARLLAAVGDQHRARESLTVAWEVATRVPDRQTDPARLRRDIAVTAAWIERDAGWWDAGLAWLDRVDGRALAEDAEYQLLRGLLLAGRGDLDAAMRLSFGLPPVRLPVVSLIGEAGFLGLKREDTDLLARWLQAEVWLRRGEPELAWHVLGEIPHWRRVVPLADRLWQDLGLYAEISGDGRADLFYALSYLRRPYRRSVLPVPMNCDGVILGLPRPGVDFYLLESGAYHGGSLFAFAASTAMLALDDGAGVAAEQHYLLAQESLGICMRRGIHPDEALALRGRLRFSRGYYVLAETDLAAARASFAGSGLVDPWTSYLLGLVAIGRERPDEAVKLLEEAVGADPELAGAWNALGVARLQLGELAASRVALDRAVALDPRAAQSWYNRGLLRCQTGDLAGGLQDFQRAAPLAPADERLARVIQLARLAEREGQPFLPGIDHRGRWSPAPVDVHAHENGDFAPQPPLDRLGWYQHLERVLDEELQEIGTLARAGGFDAAQLARLEDEYAATPTPELRKVLAFGFAILDLPEEAQRLLASHWGDDLDADETMLLLWLDQRTGEQARLAELVWRLRAQTALEVDGFTWAQLARAVLGEDKPDRAMQTGFARFDASVRSINLGGQWGRWLARQSLLVEQSAVTNRSGEMVVDPRGRAYRLTGAPRGTAMTGK